MIKFLSRFFDNKEVFCCGAWHGESNKPVATPAEEKLGMIPALGPAVRIVVPRA
jgi:hypothetical protein